MAPVKRLAKKEIGLQQRPWITPDIMSAINERNKLYKEFIEEKSPDYKIDKFSSYKAKRNLVTSTLRKAKKTFYNAFFEENKNNIKETWKGIRNLINVSKKATTNIDKIVENGKETTNPIEIADALNTFYVNIGKSVEQTIPKGKTSFSNYLYNRNIFNIVLIPCTHEEVGKYISSNPQDQIAFHPLF